MCVTNPSLPYYPYPCVSPKRRQKVQALSMIEMIHDRSVGYKVGCGFVPSNGSVRDKVTQGAACGFDSSNAVPPLKTTAM